jgi:RNA polymerase sigma-70 factor (ECF subfamily)
MTANSKFTTNPTIFVRLRNSDPEPREIAWDQFTERYAPVIRAFARKLGVTAQDVDDLVQDVLLGFFLKSPTFVYDPAKGRFRGYLKVCTYRALQARVGKRARFQQRPLDQVPEDAVAIEQVWADVWEEQQLQRALEQVRASAGQTKAFRAFELYVMRDQPAPAVAEALGMHLKSVYRAREQIMRLLHEKVAVMNKDDED